MGESQHRPVLFCSLMQNAQVLIVGGGIGGLTTALCLAAKGIRSVVFEQSVDFSQAGAGIQIGPNASRVLHQLGLEAKLRRTAFLPTQAEIRQWKTGRLLSINVFDSNAGEGGFPHYHLHRSDLISVLADTAQESPLIQLQTGAKVVEITQTEAQVELIENGSRHSGEALIAADGIHSMVREKLFGLDAAQFTGNVAWRALVPANKLPRSLGPVAGVWWGPGKHFVHYYVRGGSMVNCVCVVEKSGWHVESWVERGERDELKRDFTGWNDTIQMLISHMGMDDCYKWALFDRAPMQQWSKSRITLLGDACHATLPFMAQGAAMAIEDAAVLAECLNGRTGAAIDVANGLIEYENLRKTRTRKIQLGSRRNATIFHLGGVKAWVRNQSMIANPAKRIMQSIYNFDVYADFDEP